MAGAGTTSKAVSRAAGKSGKRRAIDQALLGEHTNGANKKTNVRIDVMRSCEHLMREVFADSFAPNLQRFRSPFAFRGMCGDWDLSSSLQRLKHPLQQLRKIEHVMLRNFRKYAYHEAEPNASEWKWLSLAQHHGLPTRLLDWTYSPFVAMHFATNELDKMDKDGVIWMVNFVASVPAAPSGAIETAERQRGLHFQRRNAGRELSPDCER